MANKFKIVKRVMFDSKDAELIGLEGNKKLPKYIEVADVVEIYGGLEVLKAKEIFEKGQIINVETLRNPKTYEYAESLPDSIKLKAYKKEIRKITDHRTAYYLTILPLQEGLEITKG